MSIPSSRQVRSNQATRKASHSVRSGGALQPVPHSDPSRHRPAAQKRDLSSSLRQGRVSQAPLAAAHALTEVAELASFSSPEIRARDGGGDFQLSVGWI